jgi:hypothetical protein
MRAKGVGATVGPRGGISGVQVDIDSPKEAVRVTPETWKQLAKLRRPLVDAEGNLVAFESFDRVVRRLLVEHRARNTSGERPGRTPQ